MRPIIESHHGRQTPFEFWSGIQMSFECHLLSDKVNSIVDSNEVNENVFSGEKKIFIINVLSNILNDKKPLVLYLAVRLSS